jgi:transcriptional regulator with XRE-family HTH domain
MTVSRGKRIQRRRLLQGLDQAELAQRARVSVRTLGRIEAGNSETSRAIPRLEAVLGIDDEPDVTSDSGAEPEVRPEPRGLDDIRLGEATRWELIQQLLRLELEEQRRLGVDLPTRPFSWPWRGMPGHGEQPETNDG